jgi:hypothetical protein
MKSFDEIISNLKLNFIYDILKCSILLLAPKLGRFVTMLYADSSNMLKVSHTLFVEDCNSKVTELFDNLKYLALVVGGLLVYKLIFEKTSLQRLIVFRKVVFGAIMLMLIRNIYLSVARRRTEVYTS